MGKCESRHCLFVLKLWYLNLTSLIRTEIKESKPVFINNSPQAFNIINVHLFSTVYFFLHFCCEGENDWQVLLSWATGRPLSSRRQMTGDAPWCNSRRHDKHATQQKWQTKQNWGRCFRKILLYKYPWDWIPMQADLHFCGCQTNNPI